MKKPRTKCTGGGDWRHLNEQNKDMYSLGSECTRPTGDHDWPWIVCGLRTVVRVTHDAKPQLTDDPHHLLGGDIHECLRLFPRPGNGSFGIRKKWLNLSKN